MPKSIVDCFESIEIEEQWVKRAAYDLAEADQARKGYQPPERVHHATKDESATIHRLFD